jgi:glycosyltransferase involved in cell wall biosynthesis
LGIKPLVSIGMPVFNGERFIEEAVDSILGQTCADFELIISDNASTDRTAEISRAYAGRDRRIRYRRNETNLGAAENYNRVFRAASGRYFKWAAHDDVCAPEFVERCVDVLERDPAVVLCYTRSIFIDETGKQLSEYSEEVEYTSPQPHRRLRTWLMERPGGWCNLVFGLIRADLLGRTALIGKFAASDYILVAELALLGKLVELPEPLFFRRDHPGRSALAHPGVVRTTLWFDPTAKKHGVYLPRWRWLVEYLKAVRRVRIRFLDKVRSGAVVLRWAIRVRYQLRDEVVTAARTIVRRPRPEQNPSE